MDHTSMPKYLAVLTAATLLLASPHTLAGVQPVQIGVNSQWHPQLAKNAKLGWVRLNIWWKDIQPSPGTWNWSEVDFAVNSAKNQGLNVLAIIGCPPQWIGGGSNCTTPPLSLTEWTTFVDIVANRYKNGKVNAYEIWNEPDFKNHAVNIGWNRSHNEPPYYADFVRAAARVIRQRTPGTPVIVPAFSSRADNSSKVQRRKDLLQKLETIQYPDGHASSFVDGISAHANGKDDRGPLHTAQDLRIQNLNYVRNRNPRNANKPVWVTEYGWKSGQVGAGGQRFNICSITKAFTGHYRPDFTGLDQYNIRQAFIYTITGDGTWGIFNDNGTPKPVVTNYLQKFSFPAVQQPAGLNDFPTCQVSEPPPPCPSQASLWSELHSYGLSNPSAALPFGFDLLFAGNVDGAGCPCPPEPCIPEAFTGALILEFADTAGNMVILSAAPNTGKTRDDQGQLGPHGASWIRDDLSLSVTVSPMDGFPSMESTEFVRRVAGAFDSRFGNACVLEWVEWEEWRSTEGSELPIAAVVAPVGYKLSKGNGVVKTYQGRCETHRERPALFEVAWSLQSERGTRIDAGAYRFEGTEENLDSVVRDDRLHWPGSEGVRYWVADVTAESGSGALREELIEVARVLDPMFPAER